MTPATIRRLGPFELSWCGIDPRGFVADDQLEAPKRSGLHLLISFLGCCKVVEASEY